MFLNNIELLISFIKYLKVQREARGITQQWRQLTQTASQQPATAQAGAAGAAIELAAGIAAGGADVQQLPEPQQSQQQQQADGAAGREGHEHVHRQQQQLLTRAEQLVKRAHNIEARALLYPTLYVPDVTRVLQVCVCMCGVAVR